MIVPLLSWCQVVETIQVLQETSEQRDSSSLLHETSIFTEQKHYRDHQLWKEYTYIQTKTVRFLECGLGP